MTKVIYGMAVAIATLLATSGLASAQTANAGASAGAAANASAAAGALSTSRAAGYGGSANSSFKSPRAPGAIGMAGLAASSGCMGSTSIGASFIGGGFGIGSTWQDDRCNAREDARLLAAFGYRSQALQILIINSPMVRQVMQPQAGVAPVAYRPNAAPVAMAQTGSVGTCNKWKDGVKGGLCLY